MGMKLNGLFIGVFFVLAAAAVSSQLSQTGGYLYKTPINTKIMQGGGIALINGLNAKVQEITMKGTYLVEDHEKPLGNQGIATVEFSFPRPTKYNCPKVFTLNQNKRYVCTVRVNSKINPILFARYPLASNGINLELNQLIKIADGLYDATSLTKVTVYV